jgi:L-alanine-DL-glutamate epimerase-like enolase superfamily enzyme
MRILEIRECSVPISRYNDASIPSGNLTTSAVELVTDLETGGEPIIGRAFSSIGRYAQSGLIRERFAPRLLSAPQFSDPRDAWQAMMRGEKPGGHGERCVAVGTLDAAVWDAAAKAAGKPLYRYIADMRGTAANTSPAVYAGGGYPYPHDDVARLRAEIAAMREMGFSNVKIKIGAGALRDDLQRVEAAIDAMGGEASRVAVDAMNAYDREHALQAARALRGYGLWWFEDVCDPLDFVTQADVVQVYGGAIAAGEALFSAAEALLLDAHGGLRRQRDILLFDPIHCYGITGYLQIVDALTARGWPRRAFWPHGGHLLTLHVAAALDLGGAECNPFSFAPFGNAGDALPNGPGAGLESTVFAAEELRTALRRSPPVRP